MLLQIMLFKEDNLLNLKMELSTMDNGKETFDKVKVFKYGLMEPSIKVNGIIIKPKEKANLHM